MHGVSTWFEFRHLRYFLAVAEELHFGRAARRLGIAQPPLSQQIAALERKLGVTLFDRGNRQVRLTPAGRAFLVEAERILALTHRLPAAVVSAASGQSGILSVGVAVTASIGVIARVLKAFRQNLPGVRIVLEEGSTDDHLAGVEGGVLDVALIRGPIVRPGIRVDSLRREAIVLAAAADHPLASQAVVRWSDLAENGFVMFPRVVAPPLYDTIIAHCTAAGFSLNVVEEAAQWPTIAALIAAGAGLGFAPASASSFMVEGITFCQLEETATTEIVAASRLDNTSSALRVLVAVANDLS